MLFAVKYRHPAAFFANFPRLNQLVQGIENLSTYSLEVPEACNIHPSVEVSPYDMVSL